MAEITIKARVVPRCDNAEKWTAANPILSKGEIGIELDTNLMKIGDGITEWNSLYYISQTISESEIEAIFSVG